MINKENYTNILSQLDTKATLVAVSKTKPAESIMELYNLGQRDFGENYVHELVDKYTALPKDIRWHFIGHLQSNKVKYIAPFVELIHGVDSLKLLQEIHKQGEKNNRIINVLLQVYIAMEETKFGLNEEELLSIFSALKNAPNDFKNINVCGLMGMASFTDDVEKVRNEFKSLASLKEKFKNDFEKNIATYHSPILSMGMSSDYTIAIEEGSNMVRIGSLLLGERK